MRRRSRNGQKPAAARPEIRCAIYTRKSSDEGLQQEFNSLDAQREAAEAYIASQAISSPRRVGLRRFADLPVGRMLQSILRAYPPCGADPVPAGGQRAAATHYQSRAAVSAV